MEKTVTFGSVYVWLIGVIFGLPLLCGFLIVAATWLEARENVRVWRHEFQYALNQQCPQVQANIIAGAGKVYLDAYQLDYQWHSGSVICLSNGRTVRCNCAAGDIRETDVTRTQE